MWHSLLQQVQAGVIKTLARCISYIENEHPGYEELLRLLPGSHTPVIGITGPPGAGKSTLTDALIGELSNQGKRVAVLCVDPSSPFNQGALLGDRIRMSKWYNDPKVFIRSLASRGSLGGLNPKIIEITDLTGAAPFDYIIVETVGVGQSEIEIAGLADVTVVVIVPEAGDEVQTMKSGLMEIADIFIVNKADRPGADLFINNLKKMPVPAFGSNKEKFDIIKTVATSGTGVEELAQAIYRRLSADKGSDKKYYLLAEKAWQLIREKRMSDINKEKLYQELKAAGEVNLYVFLKAHFNI